MPDFRAVLIRQSGDTQHAELAQLALAELMDLGVMRTCLSMLLFAGGS
ncbi:MAG TPA: hypothetical protein VHU18_09745 [Rhizomicrobium sp.]|jgi:hypothetical protein|nr:hypothetical protein [Rhizomicrobium sp.]